MSEDVIDELLEHIATSDIRRRRLVALARLNRKELRPETCKRGRH